ncbi:MAG: hypothetical protein COB67_06925, partial [SAR324 cluster bacterium]
MYTQQLLDQIRSLLSMYVTELKFGSADLKLGGENFLRDLLALTHGYALKNINESQANAPAIDLVEENGDLAIQVTANSTIKTKVKETVEKFVKYQFHEQYKRLIVFHLVDETVKWDKSIEDSSQLYSLDWKRDVWDFKRIVEHLDSKNDPDQLEKVNQFLKKHVGEIPSTLGKLTPIPRNAGPIIGRSQELQDIHQRFETAKIVLLLKGIGGIGKTVTAREYLSRFGHHYQVMAWINFQRDWEKSLVSELLPYFEFSGEEKEVYKKILLKLQNMAGKKILVLDNFNKPNQQRELQQALHDWHILITSRQEMNFPVIPIDEFSLEEGI